MGQAARNRSPPDFRIRLQCQFSTVYRAGRAESAGLGNGIFVLCCFYRRRGERELRYRELSAFHYDFDFSAVAKHSDVA